LIGNLGEGELVFDAVGVEFDQKVALLDDGAFLDEGDDLGATGN